ncbi:hypothetical protein [Propionivibrio sp.]|uniref:hypothetical protein n=1 Tax=Propionivibrio sp. TaxID=2212460 RepID=UPI0039E229CD
MNACKPFTALAPVLLVLALAASSPASAGDCGPPPPPPRGEMKGPPPFDPALCNDKAAGTAVEITAPDGRTVRGTCQLVFLPDRPPGQEPPR